MRKFIIAAVLALGGLGVIGSFSEAKAQYPWGYMSVYRFGGAYAQQYNWLPVYWYNINPYWYSQMYASPAYARFYRTPYNVGAIMTTRAMTSYYFSPYFGFGMYYTTPGYTTWNYSPIVGYRTFTLPPQRFVNTSFYSGYVPPGYILP